jgi:hypothetical protein
MLALEDIQSLPSWPICDRDQLPHAPGIYFAIGDDDSLLYLGRSNNVWYRWQNHHKHDAIAAASPLFRISVLVVHDIDSLPALEARYIRAFDPPLNDATSYEDYGVDGSEEILDHPKVRAYLENPEGIIPEPLRRAIKDHSDLRCYYCGAEVELSKTNIRYEIADAVSLLAKRDFSVTGLMCIQCQNKRGGGGLNNAAQFRQKLFEFASTRIREIAEFLPKFGVNVDDLRRFESKFSSEIEFHGERVAKAARQSETSPATQPSANRVDGRF